MPQRQPTAPLPSAPTHPAKPLPLHQATDLLLDPIKSTQPRYRAYIHARHRFWDSFPAGLYARLPTPGIDLECGLYALRLSMQHQHPGVRAPTLRELRAVFGGRVVRGENEMAGMDNRAWFTVDQLGAVFAEWGRQYLNGDDAGGAGGGDGEEDGEGEGEGGIADDDGEGRTKKTRKKGRVRCQMGYVANDGVPVMMDTPEIETAEENGEGIVRVWVYNDGWSLSGGVGHFEGMRRPTGEEMDRRS
ncbi:hypothetical protein VTI74DRAFT_6073 [Chaetomium olivicolor]